MSRREEVQAEEKGTRMQQLEVEYGLSRVEYEVNGDNVVEASRPLPPSLDDPVDEVRNAVESPLAYPALRRALTEDDSVTLVIDERLPNVGELLTPIVEHIHSAGVAIDAITLLCAPSETSRQEWLDELPDELDDLRIEVHNPKDEQRHCYLATTKAGRRIYLNRSLVEADQVVALTARRFDPLFGHDGCEGSFFPVMGDEATRSIPSGYLHYETPTETEWQSTSDAREINWLLGAPFFIQVIEGVGDTISHVLGGVGESREEGDRLLEQCWRMTIPTAPDLVVATLNGDPHRHTFADFAAAVFNASRVVRSNGHIVLLSEARPKLDSSVELAYRAGEPDELLTEFEKVTEWGNLPLWLWCKAASQAHLYVASGLEDDFLEELFATPLANAEQGQRLIESANRVLILEDAHKALPVVA